MSDQVKRRPRRSQEEWQQLLDEQASSGLTQAAFCAANGVSVASFHQWKRKLTKHDSASVQASTPWVELGTLASTANAEWDVELQLGEGICLRLRRC